MTPDEYCDTIRNIAFDRETTKAAFEAGRLDYAKDHDQDLTIAYMDGHARGRESLRIELERQEAVAWHWVCGEDHEMRCPDGLTVWPGAGPDADVEALGASRGRAVRRLYARPIPPPDVRELVELLESIRQYGLDTLSGNAEGPSDVRWYRDGVREIASRADTALAKHRGQP